MVPSKISALRLASFESRYLGIALSRLGSPHLFRSFEQDFARANLLAAWTWLEAGSKLDYFQDSQIFDRIKHLPDTLMVAPKEFLDAYGKMAPSSLIKSYESFSGRLYDQSITNYQDSIYDLSDIPKKLARSQFQSLILLAESLAEDETASGFLAAALFAESDEWNAAITFTLIPEDIAWRTSSRHRVDDVFNSNTLCAGFIRMAEHMDNAVVLLKDIHNKNAAEAASLVGDAISWLIDMDSSDFRKRYRQVANLLKDVVYDGLERQNVMFAPDDRFQGAEGREAFRRKFQNSIDKYMQNWNETSKSFSIIRQLIL